MPPVKEMFDPEVQHPVCLKCKIILCIVIDNKDQAACAGRWMGGGMKKAVAILGSPRKRGNAAKMLDAAVKSAKKAGYEVDFFDLYHIKMDMCRGCMGCKQSGVCVIEDDIAVVRQALLSCDLLIIASPTYFANVTAPVKNMFDRLVGAIMDDNNSTIPKPKLSHRQKYILLVTCNTPFPFDRLGGQSSGCLRNMREFFHISGMKSLGNVVFAGTRGKDQIPQRLIRKIESKISRA